MKKEKTLRCSLRLVTVVAMVCLLITACLPMTALAVNENVTACTSGVLQVNLEYRDDNNSYWKIAAGSGFLINNDTLVTCAHCVNLTDTQCAIYAELLGKSVVEIKDRLSYSVTVARDVTVSARIYQMSVEMDFAILILDQSLQNATPLKIRSADNPVQQTESIYAIGFPDESMQIQAVNTYTSDDVTITQGVVNKVARGTNLYSGADTDYLQTSCKITNGNSGGPMVDENGYVAGVCEGATGEGAGMDYFFAIDIQQITQICDQLGIAYEVGGSTSAVPEVTDTPDTDVPEQVAVDTIALYAVIMEAESITANGYTDASYAAMSVALDAARAAKNSDSQTVIDAATSELRQAIDALEHEESNNLMLILIIAGVVVVAIVVILIVVVSAGGKKKKAAPAKAAPPVYTAGPAHTGMATGGFAPSRMDVASNARPNGTVALNPEAGETTILSQGAGETTVLSKNVNGGTLVRLSNKERVAINKPELSIGRERKRVDYCISDNTSISRLHVKLVVRDGKTYLSDMNAANGTFVNGVKATPYQEIPLKDGDKITLAAEDFEFQA